jgi:predicted phosphodiesterase
MVDDRITPEGEHQKKCRICGKYKPTSEFYTGRRKCKPCYNRKASDYTKTDEGKKVVQDKHKRYYTRSLETAKTFGTIQTGHIETMAPFIDIWLRFDNHYGHYQCDVMSLNSYVKYLQENDHVFQILGGDILENVLTLPGKSSYARSQVMHPLKQINDVSTTLDRALCYLIGNHEGRAQKIDLTLKSDLIYKLGELKVPILTENNHIYRLFVNDIEYTFLLTHGWGGSQTPEYLVKKMFYDGLVPDMVDFLVVGHTHHNQPKIVRDKAVIYDGVMATKRIVGIRPGSFLYNPDYLRHGRETIRGNVILRLSTNKHNYRLFDNLTHLKEDDL